MVVVKWKGTVAAALLGGAMACAQPPAPVPMMANQAETIITLREAGQRDQKCKILKTWNRPDGSVAYDVQVLATGERMTLVEGKPSTAETSTVDHAEPRGIKPRLFPWNRKETVTTSVDSTPFPGVVSAPPSPAPVVWPTTPAPKLTNRPIANQLTVGQAAPSGPAGQDAVIKLANMPTTSEVAPAAPGDWHQSWGKAEDHRAQPTSAKELPHANLMTADPLKDPNSFSRTPIDAVAMPSAPMAASSSGPVVVPGQEAAGSVVCEEVPQNGPRGLLHKLRDAIASRRSGETIVEQPGVVINPEMTSGMAPMAVVGVDPTGAPVYGPMPRRAEAADPDGEEQAGAKPNSHYYHLWSSTVPASTGRPDRANAFSPSAPQGPPTALANAFGPGTVAPGTPVPQEVFPNNPYATLAQRMPGDMPQVRQPGEPRYSAPPPRNDFLVAGGQMPTAPTAPATEMAVNGPSAIAVADTPRLLAMLKNGPLPSEREWVVESLAAMDWQHDARILTALLKAAHDDPAPMVRAACVRCLVRMNPGQATLQAAVQAVKADPDLRVRQEADAAQAQLTASRPSASSGAVPASLVMPDK
jgi:hypothetical protein